MRVCFVTTSFIRSAEDHYARFVYEQAKSLRLGDETNSVVVVAPHAPGLAGEESIDGLQVQRARYFWPTRLERLAYQHEGVFETLKNSWLAAVQLPLLLLALLLRLGRASQDAQIIHAQWVPTAVVAIVVGWLRRIPVVVSVRGADLNTARSSRMGRLLTRAVISRVSYVVTVSDEFRNLLVSELGCPTPVAALYNGVDAEQFHPRDRVACRRELGLPERDPIALYVGALIERKGVKVLLQALARDTVSASDLDLYLAGEGPQLDALKALTSANGLTDRVHFLGKVSKDHIHLWMGAADVLVLPSYSEGRPNVVLEAMASGIPVVATAVNGTLELISDGEDGLLFEPGDVAGLAACLRRLLQEPGLAAKLSARGPETIRTRGLSWLTHGRQLLSIYQQVQGTK
jgi:glycosyltransferase involved in cell wall biosynthesis